MVEAPSRGVLYLVGTPIGNLEDITLRALRILRQVDLIAAEDTRQTRKLLAHYDIHTPLCSYRAHNAAAEGPRLVERLRQGQSVALVSDAGMPGISDPGQELVQQCLAAAITVAPVPGPTAAVTALVVSGLPAAAFVFAGFLPRTGKKRRQALADLARQPHTWVVYESPHRLVATLADLERELGDRPVAVARELTKKFEEVVRGTAAEVRAYFELRPPRGEFTLVVQGRGGDAAPASGRPAAAADGPPQPAVLHAQVQQRVAQGQPRKEAMRSVAQEMGLSRRAVYQAILAVEGEAEAGN